VDDIRSFVAFSTFTSPNRRCLSSSSLHSFLWRPLEGVWFWSSVGPHTIWRMRRLVGLLGRLSIAGDWPEGGDKGFGSFSGCFFAKNSFADVEWSWALNSRLWNDRFGAVHRRIERVTG
jgi:hypothetical protein